MHIQGHGQSLENRAHSCGGPESVSWSYLHGDTCFTLGLLWSHSFPLIRSWLGLANPSEQRQKAVTTSETPGVTPSNQDKSTNPYHTISGESHNAHICSSCQCTQKTALQNWAVQVISHHAKSFCFPFRWLRQLHCPRQALPPSNSSTQHPPHSWYQTMNALVHKEHFLPILRCFTNHAKTI